MLQGVAKRHERLRENLFQTVIPTLSGAKGRNLALSVFKAVRDPSSPAPRPSLGAVSKVEPAALLKVRWRNND
jgi:hypothetical protein